MRRDSLTLERIAQAMAEKETVRKTPTVLEQIAQEILTLPPDCDPRAWQGYAIRLAEAVLAQPKA